MAFSYTKLACVSLVICVVVAAAPAAEAQISCGVISSSLTPCMTYLEGISTSPSSACCNGVKSLNTRAVTTADRQTACRCLKSAAGSISSLVPDNAGSLPRMCNVNIGYPISANVDCSNVH